MVKPLIILIFVRLGYNTKFERFVFASLIPFYVKDCIDVVIWNNQTDVWIDVIGLIIVLTIGYIWATMTFSNSK